MSKQWTLVLSTNLLRDEQAREGKRHDQAGSSDDVPLCCGVN